MNGAGSPWRVISRGGAVEGRALRARRSSHESRQWARSALVEQGGEGEECPDAGAIVSVAETVSRTVWVRKSCIHWRRIWQRGQSPHRTGWAGTGGAQVGAEAPGASSMGCSVSAGDGRGQNTALTRRGFLVAPDS